MDRVFHRNDEPDNLSDGQASKRPHGQLDNKPKQQQVGFACRYASHSILRLFSPCSGLMPGCLDCWKMIFALCPLCLGLVQGQTRNFESSAC